MSTIPSLDGHAAVIGEEEREERLRLIRQEGVQLLSLYQSIPDKTVRDANVTLVTSINQSRDEPTR
jgi:hypothetical protein